MPRRSERPRVLIIVQNLPVPLDRRVWLESQALRDAGYEVSVICPRGPGDPKTEVLDGIRLYKYRPAPPTRGVASFAYEFAYCFVMTLWLALKVRRQHGFDVVQACNPPDTYWLLALLFRPFGCRFVFDQHDLCVEVYRARFESPSRVLLTALRLLERASYRTADHVISTNAFYREAAVTNGGRDVSDITVVRNGPQPDRFVRGAPDPELRRGRQFLCCYLGIMGPQDGVDLIVRVAHLLVHEWGRTDVQFALLGFGDDLADLQALAKELDVAAFCEFTGRADDDMVRRWLSTADVGLVPDPKTPFNDVSSMNKTVEYMAFGLPLVAFDLRETMATAETAGVYVTDPTPEAYARCLVELLDDEDRRTAMGTAGRAKFERALSWDHQGEAYVRAFDQVTERA